MEDEPRNYLTEITTDDKFLLPETDTATTDFDGIFIQTYQQLHIVIFNNSLIRNVNEMFTLNDLLRIYYNYVTIS